MTSTTQQPQCHVPVSNSKKQSATRMYNQRTAAAASIHFLDRFETFVKWTGRWIWNSDQVGWPTDIDRSSSFTRTATLTGMQQLYWMRKLRTKKTMRKTSLLTLLPKQQQQMQKHNLIPTNHQKSLGQRDSKSHVQNGYHSSYPTFKWI